MLTLSKYKCKKAFGKITKTVLVIEYGQYTNCLDGIEEL